MVYLAAAGLLLAAALALTFLKDDPRSAASVASTPNAAPTAPRAEPPDEAPQGAAAPRLLGEGGGEVLAPEQVARRAPARSASGGGGELFLSVPKLELESVPVPSGSTQQQLDREGILRMAGTGLPSESGSNTFIVGHTLGYQGTKLPYAFYELDKLRPGDTITLEDAAGATYRYRVFDEVTVRPEDYWVTMPDREGRTVVSLQSCVPIPEFDKRLVIQAELVKG